LQGARVARKGTGATAGVAATRAGRAYGIPAGRGRDIVAHSRETKFKRSNTGTAAWTAALLVGKTEGFAALLPAAEINWRGESAKGEECRQDRGEFGRNHLERESRRGCSDSELDLASPKTRERERDLYK
jgi:hypothetical protein